MALQNDKGQTEAEKCKTDYFVDFCSWDDVQSWSRELDKRRDRAFAWLNAWDADTSPTKVPAALAEQLRSWANSEPVRENAKLSDQTFGAPSEERIETIIGQVKTGEAMMDRIRNADPTTGPVGRQPGETAPWFELKPWHWLALAGLGYWVYSRGFPTGESRNG